MDKSYDVIIIGAGPIGLACGIRAAEDGLSYLILEKGCLVNSLFHYPTNMVFFSTSERLELGQVPFISHGIKPTRTEALEYFRRVKSTKKLNVNVYEKVINIENDKSTFWVHTSKDIYNSKKIILAIGFFDKPNLLGIPGEELEKVVHYYKEPHPYIDQKILVIGAGNSAVDVALETYRRGADVTMVNRGDTLEDNVKYWVKPDIENRINEGSIQCYFNSEVKKISEKSVIIKTPEREIEIENDFVLAMTGYHPDYDLINKLGITLSVDEKMVPNFNEETFETDIPGIYIAGVVCGGKDTKRWFIENSIYHAESIFNDIKNK